MYLSIRLLRIKYTKLFPRVSPTSNFNSLAQSSFAELKVCTLPAPLSGSQMRPFFLLTAKLSNFPETTKETPTIIIWGENVRFTLNYFVGQNIMTNFAAVICRIFNQYLRQPK